MRFLPSGKLRTVQYRSAIFTLSEEQKTEAIKKVESLGDGIATTIEPAGDFWAAEDYHQNYITKSRRS